MEQFELGYNANKRPHNAPFATGLSYGLPLWAECLMFVVGCGCLAGILNLMA